MSDLDIVLGYLSDWLGLDAPGHPAVAAKARELGADPLIMESYRKYQQKAWDWFFSTHDGLAGAQERPTADLDDWSVWNGYHWRQRQALADLAGLDAGAISETDAHLLPLQAALAQWPPEQHAVFQSGAAATDTCNVFVGEALHRAGRSQIKSNGKFYSAEEIYNGVDNFTIIGEWEPSVNMPPAYAPLYREARVDAGDLVSWLGHHVEVVTSVASDGTFCSIGAGRTDTSTFGTEKCGGFQRNIDDLAVRFVRVE